MPVIIELYHCKTSDQYEKEFFKIENIHSFTRFGYQIIPRAQRISIKKGTNYQENPYDMFCIKKNNRHQILHRPYSQEIGETEVYYKSARVLGRKEKSDQKNVMNARDAKSKHFRYFFEISLGSITSRENPEGQWVRYHEKEESEALFEICPKYLKIERITTVIQTPAFKKQEKSDFHTSTAVTNFQETVWGYKYIIKSVKSNLQNISLARDFPIRLSSSGLQPVLINSLAPETCSSFIRPLLLNDFNKEYQNAYEKDGIYHLEMPSIIKKNCDVSLEVQFKSVCNFLNAILSKKLNFPRTLDEITKPCFLWIKVLKDIYSENHDENRVFIDRAKIACQFISFGVGCLFGRYSAEHDGILLAETGATIDSFKLIVPDARFIPNPDGIFTVTEEDDFWSDLTVSFKNWLGFISGVNYDSNLKWLEESIGCSLRKYFNNDFLQQHVKTFLGRPIYWMVSSPSGAFRAIIYLHRYTKDTVGMILNDYVRPYRTKIDQKLRGLESITDSAAASAREKTKAKKRLAQLEKYKTEIEVWEKDSLYPMALKRIELDLDDGVKVNYRKIEGILEPVKQLEGKEEE